MSGRGSAALRRQSRLPVSVRLGDGVPFRAFCARHHAARFPLILWAFRARYAPETAIALVTRPVLSFLSPASPSALFHYISHVSHARTNSDGQGAETCAADDHTLPHAQK